MWTKSDFEGNAKYVWRSADGVVTSGTLRFLPRSQGNIDEMELKERLYSVNPTFSATSLRVRLIHSGLSYNLDIRFSDPEEIERFRERVVPVYLSLADKSLGKKVERWFEFDKALSSICSRNGISRQQGTLVAKGQLDPDKVFQNSDSLDRVVYGTYALGSSLTGAWKSVAQSLIEEQRIIQGLQNFNSSIDSHKASRVAITSVQRGRTLNGAMHSVSPNCPLEGSEKKEVLSTVHGWINSSLPQLDSPFSPRERYIEDLDTLRKN